MTAITSDELAYLRKLAEGFAADSRTGMFGPNTMLRVLDALDAAESRNAFLNECVVQERKERLGCTDEEARDLGAYLTSTQSEKPQQ